MMPYFEETQYLPRFAIVILAAGVLGFGFVVAYLQFSGDQDPGTLELLWLIWAIIAVVDGTIASVRMATEIRADGIVVYCKPLRFLTRQIEWNAIDHSYARTYSPLVEYGGWGIRSGKSGTAYTLRGKQGIQLELKDGRKILIGTQHSDAFMEAVRIAGASLH